MRNSVTGLIAAATLLLGCVASAEQKTVNDGVFTEAQVASGESVYENRCKSCHNMKFYKDTLKSWNSQPLLYLWDTMIGTMPADNPGSMMDNEYTEVLAYILSENGFPAGETTLDPYNGMDEINIVSP